MKRLLWLLERRGRWVGRNRPLSQTPSAWLRSVLTARPDQEDDIRQLTRMAEWSAYASELTPPWSAAEVRCLCRRVLDTWTLRAFKRQEPRTQ